MEVNFSLFFGLAIQLYVDTLISDDTPFDRSKLVAGPNGLVDRNGVLTDEQVRGFADFNDAHCIFCHSGPLFSLATQRTLKYIDGDTTSRTMVNRIRTMDDAQRLVDTGYLNNGAVPSTADQGLGNADPLGIPFAFAPQYLARLAGRDTLIAEPLPLIQACNIGFNLAGYFTGDEFGIGNLLPDPVGSNGCANSGYAWVPDRLTAGAALDNGATERRLGPVGAQFKIPQLYNIELTGPYMHNGGMATLDQVLDHYLIQEGNFRPGNSANHSDPDMHKGLIFGFAADRQALKAFLTSLTDERVRYERAPFDHPQLLVPHGHPGDHHQTVASPQDPGLAQDELLVVPAVGRNGRGAPLGTFYDGLPD